ncbi:hypothetical protein GBA52_020611, partial [Prunus armeniaca]
SSKRKKKTSENGNSIAGCRCWPRDLLVFAKTSSLCFLPSDRSLNPDDWPV